MTFFCIDESVAVSQMPSFLPAMAVEADEDEAENPAYDIAADLVPHHILVAAAL